MRTEYPPLALWGLCDACSRWYYIQTRHVDEVTWQCPVCSADPERLENRAHLVFGASDLERPAVLAGAPQPELWHG